MTRIILLFSIFAMLSSMQAQKTTWKQLFNGRDLSGWKHVGPGEMTVENGVIRTHGGMGLLYWTGGPDRQLRAASRLSHAG